MSKEMIAKARKAFEKNGHKAVLVANDARYTIIDWKRADGGENFGVTFIVDKQHGTLIVSGDLGGCIASWRAAHCVADIAAYVHDVDYFIEKMECSTAKYHYETADVLDDLLNEIEESGLNTHDLEFQEQWDLFRREVNVSETSGIVADTDICCNFLDYYLGDDWYLDLHDYGRRVAYCVYLWSVGFQMAVKQLQEEGLLSEEA